LSLCDKIALPTKNTIPRTTAGMKNGIGKIINGSNGRNRMKLITMPDVAPDAPSAR